ncbi:MAG: HlyD family type I secretion periplasmic adaptor subunit [Thioclava marina]|jgi:type I secretion membrane fusion protein, HlyD family|uniref:Membrane fusion protein (MFP) family protein n=1 Tax=Thioclava marina TaxID=1915077 RepID=A0ABX3MPU9_9RHOB|nr:MULTISPECIES: HlyD family type I secretion periplasmic adaptor subunit [Thioclava]TNE94058.1 MAG: HlyD family type I secretion periplasmic adaptor subunit [Paracoccaceae bacterium]MBC7145616.1 HlyD family type I secretion periplasmic adaptor subunit [Thioclava marina]MBD3804774.1 HlyD family type I secretion periplasmic adaptor subunit [Thioclava sp.]OOY12108.1 secretion protein HlyD [Thioclava marina]OOY27703.1 secretion protein HlyD [Thioclava sp. L04-15]
MSMQLTNDGAPEWFAEVPRSIRGLVLTGLAIFALAFGGFGVWAFTAPLAAAVMAPGSFVATGRNKMIQHLEGGIIKEIHVSEGDFVTAGQPLMRLDETSALANERALFLRRARLEAMEARILAEYDGWRALVFPDWLSEARRDPEIAAMMDSQQLSFDVTKARVQSELDLLSRNISAMESRADGYRAQLTATKAQHALLSEDHESKAQLFESGLIRRTELNALRRALADAEGQIGRLHAEVAESEEMRAKYEAQKTQTIETHRQAALDELESVQAELDSVREQERKANSVLKRVVIDSPVSGTVVRLNYSGVGGVVEAGKVIAEILPSEAPLIIETMIARTDIDAVKVGQAASVRLSALNQRTTPILTGEVYYISADAIVERSGDQPREVYLARIRLPASELRRVPGFAPMPGMPVEVMIQTASRSFAQYIAKPVVDSMNRAFREH